MKFFEECKQCSNNRGCQGNLVLCQRKEYIVALPLNKNKELQLVVECPER